jgi:hypothetical protein
VRPTRIVVSIAVLLSGCFRSLIIDEQRVGDVAEQLEQRPFDGPLTSVREQLLTQLPLATSLASTPARDLLSVDQLGGRRWHLCFAPGTDDCVDATEDDEGKVHFHLACAHVEHCAEWVWESLAPDEVYVADKRARDRQEERASHFEQSFTGRWTLAGGVWGSVRSSENSLGLGGRAGVRRWVDPYLMGAVMVEYERSLTMRNQLALHVRFELSTWSQWSERHWNLPEVTGYVYVAPLVDFGSGGDVKWGGRGGAGVQVVRLAPLFLELALQTLVAVRTEVRMIFRLGIGV